MTSTAALALVGATGVAYTAPLGTTLPTDFAAPAAAWHDMGYISGDGLTGATAEERQSWTPWGSLAPIRTQITSSVKTFALTCWETNRVVLSLFYKIPEADLTVDPVSGIVSFGESDRPTPDRRAFMFDILDGANNQIRYTVEQGEVTERGDTVYKSDDLVGYPLTFTAYPGSGNVSVRRYYKLAALV